MNQDTMIQDTMIQDTMIQGTMIRAVLLFVTLTLISFGGHSLDATEFLRGDINQDGFVSLADSQYFYNWIFRGGPAPECRDAADSNDDGIYNPRDGLWIFRHIVLGDKPPPEPYPGFGEDPTDDDPFDCGTYEPSGPDPRGPSGRMEILRVRANEGDYARFEILAGGGQQLAAWHGVIRDVDGAFANSSNDRLLSRPEDEPDLQIHDLSHRYWHREDGLGTMLKAARVVDGKLTFGVIQSIDKDTWLHRTDGLPVIELIVPLSDTAEAGRVYRLEFEFAESVLRDGTYVQPTTSGAEFRVNAAPRWVRGDCNGDGVAVQVGDAHFLLNYNFLGQQPPRCFAACDADGDGVIAGRITDSVYLLNFAFLGGPPPVAPFPECGTIAESPTDRMLGCERGAGCN